MATDRTINYSIREALRVPDGKYADDDITFWAKFGLEFLNTKTGEDYSYTDENNANTGNSIYDVLIVKLALWQIHVEYYKSTSAAGPNTGDGVFEHISSVFRREFFDLFAACYPGLVEFKGGKPIFADVAYADPWIGIADSRYDADEAVRFDAPE